MDTNQITGIIFLKTNVDDVSKSFVSERQAQNLSPHTISFYQRETGYFVRWLKKRGIDTIEEITPQEIRGYLSELGTHRNKGGVHCSYRAIKAMLYFYEFEFEPINWKNPIRKVKIAKPNIPPLEGISVEDVRKLINACDGKHILRDKAIFECLISSGCRASEFLNLNIEDVDAISGAVKIIHGKGDKSRFTFFGREARKALRKYLATHPASIQALWLNNQNERMTKSALECMVLKYSRKLGLKHAGLHDFRRCFTLACYRKGVSVFDISILLGHSSVDLTRRYLNITIDDLKLAHAKGNPLD